MKRLVIAALTAGILAGFAAGLPEGLASPRPLDSRAAGQTEANRGPCYIPWRQAYYEEQRTGPIREIIRCAAGRWNVPGGPDKAIAVFSCESGLEPDAYNPSGCSGYGCLGVSQQNARYWPGRVATLPQRWDISRSWRSARANVIVGMRMAHANGWAGWSGCA